MTKNIFAILFIFLVPIIKTYGQHLSCDPGSDCGHWLDSSYTFEKAYSSIKIDTSNRRNQWQIAVPHKIILDSAYSPTHALITDSINPILINDTSITTLKIYTNPGYNLLLQFKHKYDIDSTHQKAFLQCSFDNGNSWELMDDYNHQISCSIGEKHWTCYNSDSTVNGPYFYGNTHQWKTSGYIWEWAPIVVRLEDSAVCNIPPDSMFVRFIFENDSVAVANEGWMIDNINVYYVQGCGGVNTLIEPLTNIYPNPAFNYISIKNSAQVNYIKITNLYGQISISQEEQNRGNQKIDISLLIPGIYFIQYKDASGNFWDEKFIKQ